jgi:hypothetical protein
MPPLSFRRRTYPDIFMGYLEPLRQLRQAGVIKPQARFFCKNRGVSLLVRKAKPFGIHDLADAVRTGARMALPDSGPRHVPAESAVERRGHRQAKSGAPQRQRSKFGAVCD